MIEGLQKFQTRIKKIYNIFEFKVNNNDKEQPMTRIQETTLTTTKFTTTKKSQQQQQQSQQQQRSQQPQQQTQPQTCAIPRRKWKIK